MGSWSSTQVEMGLRASELLVRRVLPSVLGIKSATSAHVLLELHARQVECFRAENHSSDGKIHSFSAVEIDPALPTHAIFLEPQMENIVDFGLRTFFRTANIIVSFSLKSAFPTHVLQELWAGHIDGCPASACFLGDVTILFLSESSYLV